MNPANPTHARDEAAPEGGTHDVASSEIGDEWATRYPKCG
jgi:hypothetical protein